MLNGTDAEILTWTRQRILEDAERLDMIPDDEWVVDLETEAAISASTGDETPTGFPQIIKPVRPGLITEGIIHTFDPPGRTTTADYLITVAEPRVVRNSQRSRLATLELCHRLLATISNEMVRMAAQLFLRQLAAAYQHCDGWQPSWSPEHVGLSRPTGGLPIGVWTAIAAHPEQARLQLEQIGMLSDDQVETASRADGTVVAFRVIPALPAVHADQSGV